MIGDTPLVFQDWADGVFAIHPAFQRSAASASHHWDKPHLRPLALCVSLEVEAERRIGVQVVEGVGLITTISSLIHFESKKEV